MAVHSVSALTQYIKSMFQSEGLLRNVSVEGELSNYKMYASGHCYFTLKDETASLKGVMFKSRARLLRFQPENGMKVVATGEVSVYERDGAYQLYVERLLPVGAGELSVAFEQPSGAMRMFAWFFIRRSCRARARRLRSLPPSASSMRSTPSTF